MVAGDERENRRPQHSGEVAASSTCRERYLSLRRATTRAQPGRRPLPAARPTGPSPFPAG
jgi:hypothetical protein